MTEQWRQQLQRKLADYEETPPDMSWEVLNAALPKRRVVPLWLQRVAATAAIVLSVGAGYWLLDGGETAVEEQPVAAVRQPAAVSPAATVPEEPVSVTAVPRRRVRPWQPVKAVAAVAEENDMPVDAVEDLAVADTLRDDERPAATTTATVPHRRQVPPVARKEAGIGNRLTAKVYFSNVMTGNRPTGGLLPPMASPFFNDVPSNPEPSNTNSVLSESTTPVPAPEGEEVSYHQPLRLGLSLRYQWDKRWSVEAGLLYTRLVADVTHVAGGHRTTTEQRQNYIGVPLSVGYRLWGNRRLSLYSAAGLTTEKQLQAAPWQLSLNATLGVDVWLGRRVSLYAEPGVGYYFDNRSQQPTIYQERRLVLNLTFGLRFNVK